MNAYFKPIELFTKFLDKHLCFDPSTGDINIHERYSEDLSTLEHIFNIFSTNVSDFIFYGGNKNEDIEDIYNWRPLLSFYLDIKVKQHVLRMRYINGYLPIQQIFEDYLSAIKWGVQESYLQKNSVIKRFDVFRIINNYKQSHNLNEIENQINQKLFDCSLPFEIDRDFDIPESKIVLYFNRTSKAIINLGDFNTVGDLLNYIYFYYLKDKVSSSSYGKEWIIFQLRTYEVISWDMKFRERKIDDLDLLWKKEIVLIVLE